MKDKKGKPTSDLRSPFIFPDMYTLGLDPLGDYINRTVFKSV